MLGLKIHRAGGHKGTRDVKGRDPGGLELTSMREDRWKIMCVICASHLVATASCRIFLVALHGGGAHARQACALETQKEEPGNVRHTELLHTNKVSQ